MWNRDIVEMENMFRENLLNQDKIKKRNTE